MILKAKHIAPVILVIFVVGIGGTMAFNLWKTESSKIPATYSSGEFSGEYNPADIRGSYAFSDITESFGVPTEHLAKAFGVEGVDDPGAFKCKELEDLYGSIGDGEIGTDSVRLFVALYTGLPYIPEEDTLIPSSSINVLKDRLSEEEVAELRKRTVPLSGLIADPNELPAEHTTDDDRTVKGKTTFQELQDWGLSPEAIEGAIGLALGRPNVTVRDHLMEKEIEFSTVKGKLQSLVDGQK